MRFYGIGEIAFTTMFQAQKLRHLLTQSESFVVPGVYDCLSAKLAEQAGFELVFSSGFGIAASTLGYPDYGLLTATEMLTSVGQMARSLTIPLVADIDTGYGNALNVIRTVEAIVDHDVAGIILEDQEWPKKCGHFDGKRVISATEHIAKIHAAVQARKGSGLVIIGRTDARATLGLEEAIRRGRAYYEAGADIIFVEAPQSLEELRAIATALPDIPLFANMIEGGKTPALSRQTLQEMGYKIIVYALSGLFAATHAIRACFQQLKTQERTDPNRGQLVTFPEFEHIINVEQYRQLEQQFTPVSATPLSEAPSIE